MAQDFKFTDVPAPFCPPLYPSAPFQRRRSSSLYLICIPLVIFVLNMVGVTGSAIASPEAIALLQAKECGGCHVIPGVKGAYGKAGPSLKGLRLRKRIVGGALKNSPKNLGAWLKDPKSIMPSTWMPNTGLTDKEVKILIRYLNTIK